MDGRTDTEDVRLSGLMDILKDCQQFYLNAIPGSSDHNRKLHAQKAHCYAAMLDEIRRWQARNDDLVGGMAGPATPTTLAVGPTGSGPPETNATDDFAALLQRVDRIHHSLFFCAGRPSLERASARKENASMSADPDDPGAEPWLSQSHGVIDSTALTVRDGDQDSAMRPRT